MNFKLLLYTSILTGFLSVHLDAQVPFNCVVVDSAGNSPAKPYGKAIGDLSGDGQPDLFISSAKNDGMHWYHYPDWEKYVIRTYGSWSEDCQIVDIDNDGDNDVVNGNKQGLYWYENPLNKSGRFDAGIWTEHKIGSDGTNIHDLEVADLNGDGKPDVAIRYEKENQKPVYIFMQSNPYEWMAVTKTNITHKKGEGLALGDLDGDTDTDMAIGEIWLENMGIGTAWKEHAISSNTTRMHGLAMGDFNNDGYLDIHTSIRHDHPGDQDNVSIWLSNGNPEPAFREQVLAITGSHYSKIDDIDQDGDVDIFGANWSGPVDNHTDILLWRNEMPIKD